jgi:hypothetical protein
LHPKSNRSDSSTYFPLREISFRWWCPPTRRPALGVYGSGEAEVSWIALADVATAAANAINEPDTHDAVVHLAGERLSYKDVVAVFEEATGRTLTVQQVPETALAAQRDTSSDEREKSFAGLMLGVAGGSPPGDGKAWLRRLGVQRPVTVRDVASRCAARERSGSSRRETCEEEHLPDHGVVARESVYAFHPGDAFREQRAKNEELSAR